VQDVGAELATADPLKGVVAERVAQIGFDGVAGLPSVAPCSAPPGREAPYHGVITMTDLRDHDDRSA
jgi:hypothetical protein